ncbi:serine/threonine-protein kinase [Bythopirellula goksoeyrii]|uniref:Serine/threonine-protein kinase PrkC n=1 Tax=Bythopirellula goksoeyrii TaxID=1400387 RepID=A0A5B9QV85_9BACT|nr:serine/threonine-protein kinase [Bythopirellula goksoeyrii]QEG37921.1 Serine/threonine-protein kinase PrkC [Bythopirellula goksoeyrii]
MISEPSQTLNPCVLDDRELAEVLDSYLASLEEGTPLDVTLLATEHPRLAEDIRAFAASVEMLHEATQGVRAAKPSKRGSAKSTAPFSAGPTDVGAKRLGDFQIGAEIGRGGMGVVYEAQQISLQRKVALKVLPFAAMWDHKQLARFQNEAQAAAQLHHPNIVPVFAVGEERGVHFYAMQFIAGRSLDRVVHALRNDEEDASSPESAPHAVSTLVAQTTQHSGCEFLTSRHAGSHAEYCVAIARLGIQAANALHHAHQCGVIHRDIKPSNLLLDDRQKLWITDFGLARIANNPSVTMTGDMVGTLRYMSPEQANSGQLVVDSRTDIYSLGATLYELLTLQPAFPGEDRQEVLRAIAQKEPIAPSMIDPAIPHDLETIILSAMAKSREDRYATAEKLAEDLTRFLEGKPTLARRPTLRDRSAKWIRRHRVLVSLAASFLVVLAAVSTSSAFLLMREQGRTQAALVTAEENLQQARQVVDRFGNRFSRELAQLPGSEPLRQAVLGDTLAYYEDFIARAASDPTLDQQLASTHFQVGTIASRLGDRQRSEESYRKAYELFTRLSEAGDDPQLFRQERATCLNNLALLSAAEGNLQLAREHYTAAIDLQKNITAKNPADRASLRLLAEMLTNQGFLERQRGDLPSALRSFSAAIGRLEKIAAHSPEDVHARHDLALALNNRSFVEQETNWEAARSSCERAVELLQEIVDQRAADTPTLASWRSDLALCQNNLGAIVGRIGDDTAAVAAYRQAIETQEQLVRQFASVVQYRSELALTWNNLGQTLARTHATSPAVAAYAHALEILTELVADFPQDARYQSSLAGVLNNRAMVAEQTGDLARAIIDYESAIEHQSAALAANPAQPEFREFLSKHYFNYGRTLRTAGRPAEAASVALERRTLWADDGEHLYYVAGELAEAAQLLGGESAEQDQILQEALETFKQAESAGADVDRLRREHPLPEIFSEYSSSDVLTNSSTFPEKQP